MTDVIIIGAGIAGLTAARTLHRLGKDVLVLERESSVGGRIRTDHVDGFVLDHGFQLYNPAYPAGRRTFDHQALELQPFVAGVEIFRRHTWARLSDPVRDPTSLLTSAGGVLQGKAGRPWEVAALAAYAAACATEPVARLRARPDVSMLAALRSWGVRDNVLRSLVRPFLSGVFADVDLTTSRRYGDLVLRSFVRGRPSVPAAGMAALPQQLAAELPNVHTDCTVEGLSGTTVHTTHGDFTARVVIVATAAPAAAALLPGLAVSPMAALTTWYFTTDQQPEHGNGVLVIDGSGSQALANVAVLTSAAPSYSQGRPLIAASAVGYLPSDEDAATAREQCARLLGLSESELDEVGRYPIADALPRLPSPAKLRRSIMARDGVLVIGDHRDTPSIQGALVSGERGAEAAIRMLSGAL